MKPKVYLETTIPSYLTSRSNRNPFIAGCQSLTRKWWKDKRGNFDLFISEAVIVEASAGDVSAVNRRLNLLKNIPRLDISNEAKSLAEKLSKAASLPQEVFADALHIALATVNRIDFLLTWNCRHIANAVLIPRLSSVANSHGYRLPVICTPQELMGDTI